MYAKVFTQIFDSSIADNWKTRHVFEDMLKLADINGVVDMTHEAIAARTRVPVEMIREAITQLEAPDPESRTPDHDGRRIALLDSHRSWGWCILNYPRFRAIASEEQRREKTRLRTEKWRKRQQKTTSDVAVTLRDAGDAMQRERQRHDKASKGLQPAEKKTAKRFEAALDGQWTNDAGKWVERIQSRPAKCLRIIEEVESAAREGRIKTTPAQYAEQLWKEFHD